MLLKGILLVSVCLVTSLIGSLGLLPPLLLLLVVSRSTFHSLCNVVMEQWFLLVCLLLRLGGMRTQIHLPEGEADLPSERTYIICNHRTRLDWMFAWPLLAHLPGGHLNKLRIALKAELKSVPGFGWAMQFFRFLFIDRAARTDGVRRMEEQCKYLRRTGDESTFFIFPEGTDLSASNLEKSNKFRSELPVPLPPTQFTLHPKPTGTRVTINALRPMLDAVWDVTIAYEDYEPGERPSEKSLLLGRFPRVIHFHVQRIPIDKVPIDEEPFKQWVLDRFAVKEQLLAPFYPSPPRSVPDAKFRGSRRAGLGSPIVKYIGSVLFWTLFGYGLALSIWYTRVGQIKLVAALLLHFVAKIMGGIDKWIIGSTPSTVAGSSRASTYGSTS